MSQIVFPISTSKKRKIRSPRLRQLFKKSSSNSSFCLDSDSGMEDSVGKTRSKFADVNLITRHPPFSSVSMNRRGEIVASISITEAELKNSDDFSLSSLKNPASDSQRLVSDTESENKCAAYQMCAKRHSKSESESEDEGVLTSGVFSNGISGSEFSYEEIENDFVVAYVGGEEIRVPVLEASNISFSSGNMNVKVSDLSDSALIQFCTGAQYNTEDLEVNSDAEYLSDHETINLSHYSKMSWLKLEEDHAPDSEDEYLSDHESINSSYESKTPWLKFEKEDDSSDSEDEYLLDHETNNSSHYSKMPWLKLEEDENVTDADSEDEYIISETNAIRPCNLSERGRLRIPDKSQSLNVTPLYGSPEKYAENEESLYDSDEEYRCNFSPIHPGLESEIDSSLYYNAYHVSGLNSSDSAKEDFYSHLDYAFDKLSESGSIPNTDIDGDNGMRDLNKVANSNMHVISYLFTEEDNSQMRSESETLALYSSGLIELFEDVDTGDLDEEDSRSNLEDDRFPFWLETEEETDSNLEVLDPELIERFNKYIETRREGFEEDNHEPIMEAEFNSSSTGKREVDVLESGDEETDDSEVVYDADAESYGEDWYSYNATHRFKMHLQKLGNEENDSDSEDECNSLSEVNTNLPFGVRKNPLFSSSNSLDTNSEENTEIDKTKHCCNQECICHISDYISDDDSSSENISEQNFEIDESVVINEDAFNSFPGDFLDRLYESSSDSDSSIEEEEFGEVTELEVRLSETSLLELLRHMEEWLSFSQINEEVDYFPDLADISVEEDTGSTESDSYQIYIEVLDEGVNLEALLLPSIDTTTDCPICLTNGELNSLPCNHSFHRECITRWFQEMENCPVCRKEY